MAKAIFKHFSTTSDFSEKLGLGQVLTTDVCFIKDVKKVYLNGAYYAGSDLLTSNFKEGSNITVSVSGNDITIGATGLALASHTHAISNVTGLTLELASKLSLGGDTMSGFITLHADPSLAMHAATKQYVDSKVGATTIASKTYAELSAMVTGSTLVQGHQYLLTDYFTSYVQPVSQTVYMSFTTEPLILVAATANKFEPIVFSTLHKEDVVYYDFDNNLCENGTTARPGIITRRIDTIRNNDVIGDFRYSAWERFKVLVGDAYTPTNLGHKLWLNEELVIGDIIIDSNTTPMSIAKVKKSGTPIDHDDAVLNYLHVIPFTVNDYFLSGVFGDGGSEFIPNTASRGLKATFNGSESETEYTVSTLNTSLYNTISYQSCNGNRIHTEHGIRHNNVFYIKEGMYVNSNSIDAYGLTTGVNGFENNIVTGESLLSAFYDRVSFNNITGKICGSVVDSMQRCSIPGSMTNALIGDSFNYNRVIGQSNESIYGNSCINNEICGGNIFCNNGLVNNRINIGSTNGNGISLDLHDATHVYQSKTCDVIIGDDDLFYVTYFKTSSMTPQYVLATT